MKSILNELLNATTIGILGMKGTGKTFSSSVLANNIDKHTILLDITGAYTINRLIKDAAYIDVDTTEQRAITKALLKGFADNQRIVFNTTFLVRKNLIEFTENLFKILNQVGDAAVIIDEAADILPQTKELYSHEAERTIRLGRNWDIKPIVVITQRSAKLDKNALALADYILIFRLTHNLDLDAIKTLIGMNSAEFIPLAQEIKNLNIGECVIYKYTGEFFKAKVDLAKQDIFKIEAKSRIKEVLKGGA